MTVSDIVKKEIAHTCAIPVADIRDDANLTEYGLDSMRSMEFIVALESQFKIEIGDDDLATVRTVGDVIRTIERTAQA